MGLQFLLGLCWRKRNLCFREIRKIFVEISLQVVLMEFYKRKKLQINFLIGRKCHQMNEKKLKRIHFHTALSSVTFLPQTCSADERGPGRVPLKIAFREGHTFPSVSSLPFPSSHSCLPLEISCSSQIQLFTTIPELSVVSGRLPTFCNALSTSLSV